jgi:hypothetical protein
MNGIPRIKEVKPLDDMMLMVTFDNNIMKNYDVKKIIDKYPVFKELKNKNIFNLVHVDCGGYGISWTEEIDLSEYEIWDKGIQIS